MINSSAMSKIKPGATVRVWEKVSNDIIASAEKGKKGDKDKDKKGDKERLTRFEGLVLSRKHGSEAGATFTVRTTIAGVGVEKGFPIHSPLIEKVDIISSPKKVSRAKLYYIRTISRKAIRQKTTVVTQAIDKEEKAPVTEAKK